MGLVSQVHGVFNNRNLSPPLGGRGPQGQIAVACNFGGSILKNPDLTTNFKENFSCVVSEFLIDGFRLLEGTL